MRITLRPATREDDDFLRELFDAVRGSMFAGLPGEVAAQVLRQQHEAQRLGHATAYPAAEDAIVELDGVPVGRWLIDRSSDGVTLVDVAVLPDHQGRGIGTHLLTRLITEADVSARPIRLSVAVDNPARRLYERLGFRQLTTAGAYVLMMRDTAAGHGDEAPGRSGEDATR